MVLIRNEQKQLQLVSQQSYEKMCAKEDRAEMAACRKRWANGNGSLVNGNGHKGEENIEEEDDEDDEDLQLLPLELSNSLSLISPQAYELLEDVEGQTLESKLHRLLSEKAELATMARELNEELEEERRRYNSLNDSIANNSLHLSGEVQAEIQSKFTLLFKISMFSDIYFFRRSQQAYH